VRAGICLPNYSIDQWTDKDKRVIAAARPAALTLMAREHDRRVYDYLEAAAADWGYKPLYVVRFGDGPQTPESAEIHLNNALAQVPPAVLAEGRAVFRLGNNTDKQEEWGDLGAYQYAFIELAKRRPDMRLITTNLHDPARFAETVGCVEYAHGLGAELYGANGDPAQLQALIDTGKPIYVVECGSLLYHAEERGKWIGWRFDQYAGLKFEAAMWFIAGGESYGAWDEGYILSEEEAALLGATTARLSSTTQPEPLPVPAPVPTPQPGNPWLNTWTLLGVGGMEVRDLRAHFPEIGGTYERRTTMGEIDRFVVHHSTGDIPTTPAGALQLLESIDRYHRQARLPDWPGAPCIAYSLAVDGAGETWWANGLEIVGWAQGADYNRRGLACVWLGDYGDREPAEAVLRATVAAWEAAETAVGHPLGLMGHQEAMPGQTICPSRLWPTIKARLVAMKEGVQPVPVPAGFDYEQIKNELDAIYATANEIEADSKRRADALRAWVVSVKVKTGGEGR
jgi:hypothetical protein